MKGRFPPARAGFLLLIAVGIAVVLSSGFLSSSGSTTPPSRQAPSDLQGLSLDGQTLVWVFTRDAYESCRQPAYVLRRVRQRFGESVPLVVWYEDHDRGSVQKVLTRERLSANLRPLNVLEYEQFFGSSPEPAVHLFSDGQLLESWTYEAEPIRVADVVETVVTGSPSPFL